MLSSVTGITAQEKLSCQNWLMLVVFFTVRSWP